MRAIVDAGERHVRTFIFGAGASVHVGYPLASKLWPWLQQWASQSIDSGDYCAGAVESVKSQFDVSLSFEQLLEVVPRECNVYRFCCADSERLAKVSRQVGFVNVHSHGNGSFESWLEFQGAAEVRASFA
jgi:hypothetical protein